MMQLETTPEAPETDSNTTTTATTSPPTAPLTDADLEELLNQPAPADNHDQAAALVRTIDKLGNEILGHVHDVVNGVHGTPFEIDLAFSSLHSAEDFASREKLCRVDVDLNLRLNLPRLFVDLTDIDNSLSVLLYKLSYELERLAEAAGAMQLPKWPVNALMAILPPRSAADAVEFDIVNPHGFTRSVHGTEQEAQAALDDELKRQGHTIRHKGWSELSGRIHDDNRPLRLFPLAVTKEGRMTLKKQAKARQPKPSPPIQWTAEVNTPAAGDGQEPRRITLYDMIDVDGSLLHERIHFEQIGNCLETFHRIRPGQPQPTVRAVNWLEQFVPPPSPTAS